MPVEVAETATPSQADQCGAHGRRRTVSQPTRKTAKLKIIPPPICNFQSG
jgi:hypothetical protein